MKKLVSLLLCLSLGFFTVARATKPTHTLVAGAKTVHEKPMVQRADAENLLNDAGKTLAEENTDDVTSDDGDSLEYPS
jgi:hypothetical protein